MMFFTILSAIFILLILISIANTLIFIALKLVTKEHYKEHYLIIPSLISLILWSITYIIAMKLISSITKMSFFDSIYSSLFNTSNFTKFLPSLIFPFIVLLIITLFLQSLSLLTVNISYTLAFNKFRYFLKEKLKTFQKNINHIEYTEEKTKIKEVETKYKLNFINAFVCSFFIFSLLFFLIIIFFWIGTLIGNYIIN